MLSGLSSVFFSPLPTHTSPHPSLLCSFSSLVFPMNPLIQTSTSKVICWKQQQTARWLIRHKQSPPQDNPTSLVDIRKIQFSIKWQTTFYKLQDWCKESLLNRSVPIIPTITLKNSKRANILPNVDVCEAVSSNGSALRPFHPITLTSGGRAEEEGTAPNDPCSYKMKWKPAAMKQKRMEMSGFIRPFMSKLCRTFFLNCESKSRVLRQTQQDRCKMSIHHAHAWQQHFTCTMNCL